MFPNAAGINYNQQVPGATLVEDNEQGTTITTAAQFAPAKWVTGSSPSPVVKGEWNVIQADDQEHEIVSGIPDLRAYFVAFSMSVVSIPAQSIVLVQVYMNGLPTPILARNTDVGSYAGGAIIVGAAGSRFDLRVATDVGGDVVETAAQLSVVWAYPVQLPTTANL